MTAKKPKPPTGRKLKVKRKTLRNLAVKGAVKGGRATLQRCD